MKHLLIATLIAFGTSAFASEPAHTDAHAEPAAAATTGKMPSKKSAKMKNTKSPKSTKGTMTSEDKKAPAEEAPSDAM